MKLSKKTDYALRVLVALAGLAPGERASIRRLAAENDVPRRFLEQIMQDLREQHWVRAIPGRDGGFTLAVRPEDLSVGQVIRHFDGVLAPIGCVSVAHFEPCSQARTCRFRRIFLEIRNHTAQRLDRLTLGDLVAGVPVTQDELLHPELNAGAGI